MCDKHSFQPASQKIPPPQSPEQLRVKSAELMEKCKALRAKIDKDIAEERKKKGEYMHMLNEMVK